MESTKENKSHGQSSANFGFLLANLFKRKDFNELPSKLKSQWLTQNFENSWTRLEPPKILYKALKNYSAYYLLLGLVQMISKILILYFLYIFQRQSLISIFRILNQMILRQCNEFLLLLLICLEFVCDQWYNFKIELFKIEARIRLHSILFRKILKSSPAIVSAGKIITLITKDVHNFEILIGQANELWAESVIITIWFYFICQRVGFLVVVPIMTNAILLYVLIHLVLKTKALELKMLDQTDTRFDTVSNILSSIKCVKMSNRDGCFTSQVENARICEVNLTYRIFLVKLIIMMNATMWICHLFSKHCPNYGVQTTNHARTDLFHVDHLSQIEQFGGCDFINDLARRTCVCFTAKSRRFLKRGVYRCKNASLQTFTVEHFLELLYKLKL